MREIKFRAWDKAQKIFLWPWPEGFHILGETTCFDLITSQLTETKPNQTLLERIGDVEITQFTGLKDINGKDIYEGDIVRYLIKEDRYLNEEVYFGGGAFYPICTQPEETFKIIGNLYENPKLI